MNNIISDLEHVFSRAMHIFEYIVCRVKVIINLYLWYILNEGLEFRVQCMVCLILMQKAISEGSKYKKRPYIFTPGQKHDIWHR